jgi:acetylornithine/succinyldiaminopimelate/putrescine aminotransferase
MFREYGLKPDFVSIGKGFPGGQYPASRILTTAQMDRLNLFGALVTNGQEERASLAYLITMAFAGANQEYIKVLGAYYEQALRDLAGDYPDVIEKTEGAGHMTTLFFRSAETAVSFASGLNRKGIDISVKTYKADCPPSALTKIPLIASYKMVDFIAGAMREVLGKVKAE